MYGKKTEAHVYRKSGNTDMYIHWISYAPSSWKCSTLKTLIVREYTINYNNSYLKSELKYVQKVFHERNVYAHWLIRKE